MVSLNTDAANAAAPAAPGGALSLAGVFEAAAVAAARALNLPPSRPAMSYADPTAFSVYPAAGGGMKMRQ